MRVLFVSMEYPPETSYGGIGWYIAMMARALAGRGHEVHVLSCVRGQARRDYVEGGVQVHRRCVTNAQEGVYVGDHLEAVLCGR
jgi:glycogen synthase